MTGEIAEYVAAEKLGLKLAPPRTEGYDAIRQTPDGPVRIQIKGRAFGADIDAMKAQRIAVDLSGALARVGIDEYEWLRRGGSAKS